MRFLKGAIYFLLLLVCTCCTDPIAPEFELKEGLVFVEGFVSTASGASFVTINSSAIEFGQYVVQFVEEAMVSFENVQSGR